MIFGCGLQKKDWFYISADFFSIAFQLIVKITILHLWLGEISAHLSVHGHAQIIRLD